MSDWWEEHKYKILTIGYPESLKGHKTLHRHTFTGRETVITVQELYGAFEEKRKEEFRSMGIWEQAVEAILSRLDKLERKVKELPPEPECEHRYKSGPKYNLLFRDKHCRDCGEKL